MRPNVIPFDLPPFYLSRCPECGYRLKGLPKAHRCPECGFAFDESTKVFEGRRGSSYLAIALYSLLTLWAGFSTVWGGIVRGELFVLVVDGAITGALGLYGWGWLKRRKRYYVVVSDREVVYREGGCEKLRVQLDDVWRAEYLSLSGEVALLDRDGQRLAVIPDLRVRDRRFPEELCAAINRQREAP